MRLWYARYVGDIMKDTQHLSCEEFGAYNRLLDTYYATRKPIPNDPAIIKRFFGESLQKTKKIMKVLLFFFEEKDGFLYHNRIERELKKSEEIHEVKSKAAKDRWEKDGTGASARQQLQLQSDISNNKDSQQPIDVYKGLADYTEQDVVDLYHKILKDLIPIKKLTDKLKAQIRGIHQEPKLGCHNLGHWKNFFNRVYRSDWLSGRAKGEPSRYSLRGLIETETYTKIAEGQYDN